MSTVTLSLKQLLVPSKTVEAEFPGFPGFKVQLSFLARDTLQSIRKKATKTTFKNRQPVEEINDDLFLSLYVGATIKGWSGLKLAYLEQLAPVDLGAADLNSELDYTEDNALYLMKASGNFDAWVTEQAGDLANFPNSSKSK